MELTPNSFGLGRDEAAEALLLERRCDWGLIVGCTGDGMPLWRMLGLLGLAKGLGLMPAGWTGKGIRLGDGLVG